MPATQNVPVPTDHFPETFERTDLVVICVEGGAVKWCASDASRLRVIVVDLDGPSPAGWEQPVLPIADSVRTLTAYSATIGGGGLPSGDATPIKCPVCQSDIWEGFELRATCFNHNSEAKSRALVRWFSCVLCNRPVDDPAAIAALEVMAGAAA